jgi:two-component system, OmpR family, KDP operon response regulator KdpE
MSKTTVLVVDDDPKIRKLVRVNLERRGYLVREAPNGDTAVDLIENDLPDLVILDLVMPGISGNEMCIWIRDHWDIPIIVLSAYDEEDLKVQALDSGADDYVTKPFRQAEFLARVRAAVRRAAASNELSGGEEKVKVLGLTVDLKGRRAFVDDVDMHLTRTEFALLAALAQNLDAVLTHDELLAKVWGGEYRGSNHYLHVYFGRIRKKMGENYHNLLETVAGIGYILHSSIPQEMPRPGLGDPSRVQ